MKGAALGLSLLGKGGLCPTTAYFGPKSTNQRRSQTMSGSLNKVMLIGNLGRDPEVKMTPSGQQLARFSVATTETWKNPQGEKQSKTEWHNIVVWGKPHPVPRVHRSGRGQEDRLRHPVRQLRHARQDGERWRCPDRRQRGLRRAHASPGPAQRRDGRGHTVLGSPFVGV